MSQNPVRSLGLKAGICQNHLEGLLSHRLLALYLYFLSRSRVGWRMCMSKQFQEMLVLLGQGPHFENHPVRETGSQYVWN